MPRFDLVGSNYQSQSPNADCQETMNWYQEVIESGNGTSRTVLYPTPGLKTLIDLSATKAGGDRGMTTINGRRFSVLADSLIEFFPDGTFTVRGAVSNDSQLVSFATSAQQMLIASGGTAYVYDLGANTLTPIPGATFSGPVSMVAYCKGFFLVLVANSAEFVVSAPLDANDWVTNGAAIVSIVPDNLVSMIVSHGEVWFASGKNIVPYYASGAIFPFDVNLSGVQEQGIAAKNSFASLDNTVFWLGQDERGAAVVWRGNGYTPQRVSDHAIEFELQQFSRIDDAIAYTYQQSGHFFYVLYFPTENKTRVYDVTTDKWHKRGFWESASGRYTAHRSQCHAFDGLKHYVGDWAKAAIYIMDIPVRRGAAWDFVNDFNNPIRRQRRTPNISQDQKRLFFSKLQVYLESGLGSIESGQVPPSAFTLQDANGNFWNLGITDAGILTTTPIVAGVPSILQINDLLDTTSWQIGVTITGVLTTTAIALNPALPEQLLISSSGTFQYELLVTSLGILQTLQAGQVAVREPMMSLRCSNDAAHSWGNEMMRGMGNGGEYRKRVFWTRLGSARNRAFEISTAEPVPVRIIDGELEVAAAAGT